MDQACVVCVLICPYRDICVHLCASYLQSYLVRPDAFTNQFSRKPLLLLYLYLQVKENHYPPLL